MAISTSTADRVPRGPVTAPIVFALPPESGVKAVNYVDDPPAGEPKRNLGDAPVAVPITDIRGSSGDDDESARSYTLDSDAFALISGVPDSAERDFADDDSIRRNYYPEVERLLLEQVPGSDRVVIFDHTVRRADPSAKRKAVLYAHIDQTAASAAKRVHAHCPPGVSAESLLAGRYRIINVWRSLNEGPIESHALAFASSSSLSPEDVIPVEHIYASGYVGQTAAIAHNDRQRWYYASGMTGDERLLLECFDSEALKEGTTVKGGRVPHTAFEDPRTRPDAVGRESIEVRALVFGP